MSTHLHNAASPQWLALVEDEPTLREELAFQLQHHGFSVLAFADAFGLYRHMATGTVAAVVLDIGLPGEDGLSIANLLRSHDRQLGIVFLTARAQRDDKMTGLQIGADAYLVKPVDLDELVLVLRRLLVRQLPAEPSVPTAQSPPTEPNELALWKLNRDRATIIAPSGQTVQLTLVELQLLTVLANRDGQACKPAELGRGMGLMNDEWSQHRLEVIVSRLRNKVLRETGLPAPVRTVRGLGYAWWAGGSVPV